ncbi:hypothetical protein [Lactococcus lactis]|uniref:Uncharacterized protein n=1 Tax=Lactococcus lactis subsp. lactis A12 TaxID=1137134 RepID=S6F4K1_LACLL|nr:hypothetical protein [Lactococcus lactis]CDG03729.1 Putative uncharacterized protein [Lactococcus lactis subsp. lactis A12]SBW29618.1 Hypothetical protein LLA12_00443 [Lactococcus lactis subsp. lactis]
MKKSEQVKIANILWERLKKEFNEEAKNYDPEEPNGILGSVGEVECREVCRPDWWKSLGGEKLIQSQASRSRGLIVTGEVEDGFDDYWEITHLIEDEHYGEQLETGKILFGS